MRSLLAVWPLLVFLQQPPALTPEQRQNSYELLERARAAIDSGDVAKAERAASDLLVSLTRLHLAGAPTPQQALQNAEESLAGKNERERFYLLCKVAKAAVEAGNLAQAEIYAKELLALAPRYAKDWNYGNAVHDGPMVLGRVALRNNEVAGAKRLLLEAGQTPGSPQLDSFGPNMSLAKDLLERGERETVLQYFSLCRRFWKHPEILDEWMATVKGGGTPRFGANLRY